MNIPQDKYGMTQREVAEALGLGRGQIASLEKLAIEKVKLALKEKGISAEDILETGKVKNERK